MFTMSPRIFENFILKFLLIVMNISFPVLGVIRMRIRVFLIVAFEEMGDICQGRCFYKYRGYLFSECKSFEARHMFAA